MNLVVINCIKDLSESRRSLIVSKIRKWGGLNTDAILDSNCQLFSIPSIEGFIGYRIESNCAVVFGDPVCPLANQVQLAEAFRYYCEEQGLNVIYTIVSEQFTRVSANEHKRVLIQFGNKLVLDPSDDPLKRTGPKAVLVRKKVKHALNKGIVFSEYLTGDPVLERSIEEVGSSWLKSRHGPQVYIAHFNFFNDREGKRLFYAKQGERVVGFLLLNEIQASSGWLLNNLIIDADAPPGTSELLITSTLKVLEMEKSKSVIVGPVTTVQIEIGGLGVFPSWIARRVFSAAKRVFRLDSQRVFWDKFQPLNEPSYLIFDKINLRTVKALMRAMNVKI